MSLPLLKVSLRMMLDLVKMLEKDEKDFEVCCRCKDADSVAGLVRQLSHMTKDYPVEVKEKDELVVSIIPKHFTTLLDSPTATPCV